MLSTLTNKLNIKLYKENKMKVILVATLGALFFTGFMAQADEKYSHFPSLEAPTTSAALCNLAAFKEKLQAITAKKELSPVDMVKVHELTYIPVPLQSALSELS
jgi:hypothetical protein